MELGKQNDKLNGLILALCAVSAILICNTSFVDYYKTFLEVPIMFKVGSYKLDKPIILWVNEGLMAIFFLFVTLEIKKEMLVGSLNTNSKRVLPFWGALGGMLVPALVYIKLTASNPNLFDGWAIPTATDIVFALSLLGVVYQNCPRAVRSFLLALAVFDDIGAIIIIAMYYTNHISVLSFSLMGIFAFLLFLLNRSKSNTISIYIALGTLLWVCVLKSGVHATLAGIIVALALPNTPLPGEKISLSEKVEHSLVPWVNFFILPIFAFVNSGVSFVGSSYEHMFHIMPIAIICGLVFGKQIGITLFSYLAVKLKLADIPKEMTWSDIYGVSILCGVGFTMSLFIGTLAFEENVESFALWVRLGVIFGSLISAIMGAIFFKILYSNKSK